MFFFNIPTHFQARKARANFPNLIRPTTPLVVPTLIFGVGCLQSIRAARSSRRIVSLNVPKVVVSTFHWVFQFRINFWFVPSHHPFVHSSSSIWLFDFTGVCPVVSSYLLTVKSVTFCEGGQRKQCGEDGMRSACLRAAGVLEDSQGQDVRDSVHEEARLVQ